MATDIMTSLASMFHMGVIMNDLEQLFYNHVSLSNKQITHFVLSGLRYVRCDKCTRIVSTDDCIYYGGDGFRMLFGGCRSCYGQGVKK